MHVHAELETRPLVVPYRTARRNEWRDAVYCLETKYKLHEHGMRPGGVGVRPEGGSELCECPKLKHRFFFRSKGPIHAFRELSVYRSLPSTRLVIIQSKRTSRIVIALLYRISSTDSLE